MIAEIAVESLAARDLDHAADIVEAAAIRPSRAGIEQQRPARQVLAVMRGLQVTHHGFIPQRIGKARAVRQQLPQRDRLVGTAQLRQALGIEAGQHLHRRERRIDVRRRLVQLQPALLDKLQGGDRGEQLHHRGDAEDRVARHPRAVAHMAEAERALVEHRLCARRNGDNARDLPRLDLGAKCAVAVRALNGLMHRSRGSRRRAERHHPGRRAPDRSQQRLTPRKRAHGASCRLKSEVAPSLDQFCRVVEAVAQAFRGRPTRTWYCCSRTSREWAARHPSARRSCRSPA